MIMSLLKSCFCFTLLNLVCRTAHTPNAQHTPAHDPVKILGTEGDAPVKCGVLETALPSTLDQGTKQAFELEAS